MNQDMIRDFLLGHSRSPRNGTFPEQFTYHSAITNPLCGDHVELKIATNGDTITDAGFEAKACAICSASASLLSEVITGQTTEKVLMWGSQFESTLSDKNDLSWSDEIKFLNCFQHLRNNPSRRLCALLPWVVLRSAIKNAGK